MKYFLWLEGAIFIEVLCKHTDFHEKFQQEE